MSQLTFLPVSILTLASHKHPIIYQTQRSLKLRLYQPSKLQTNNQVAIFPVFSAVYSCLHPHLSQINCPKTRQICTQAGLPSRRPLPRVLVYLAAFHYIVSNSSHLRRTYLPLLKASQQIFLRSWMLSLQLAEIWVLVSFNKTAKKMRIFLTINKRLPPFSSKHSWVNKQHQQNLPLAYPFLLHQLCRNLSLK